MPPLPVTYASLFTGERFTGGDRLADLESGQCLVLATRFIRDDGLEQFRFSAGQINYRGERRTQLTSTTIPLPDTRTTSSLLTEAEWNPNERLSVYSTLEWDPYEEYALQNRFGFGVRYEHNNRMVNLARNITKTWNLAESRDEVSSDQIDAGLFWALNDRWAVIGRVLYDKRDYETNDPQKFPAARYWNHWPGWNTRTAVGGYR